jgi:hypothetical protein
MKSAAMDGRSDFDARKILQFRIALSAQRSRTIAKEALKVRPWMAALASTTRSVTAANAHVEAAIKDDRTKKEGGPSWGIWAALSANRPLLPWGGRSRRPSRRDDSADSLSPS